MPTYEFRCPTGHEFEKFYRSIGSAPSIVACPVCGKTAERQLSAGGGLVFKGSGFYITDYGKDGKKAATASSKSGATDSSSSSSSDAPSGGAKSEPAAKSEAKPATESKPSGESKPATASKSAAKKSSGRPKSTE